jgi:HEAT repeat protein
VRQLCFFLLAGSLVLHAPAGAAADADAAVVAPSLEGGAVVAARVLGGRVVYRACSQSPCVPSGSDAAVPLPVGTAPDTVRIEPLAIASGRHVLWAHAPAWSALVGQSPGAAEAHVLWSGSTGFTQGEDGERHGDWIEVREPDAEGVVAVLIGEAREDVSICGRPSILAPKVLDPRDLTFKSVSVQRLRREERDRAPALEAVAAPAPAAQPAGNDVHILQATSASSGGGSPAALTDGDLETTWSEKRSGDGRGEFVQMNAPEQVEITSLSFVARPPTRAVPKGAAPRKLWLATPEALFSVIFRDDPWARPGASYTVKLPQPLRTPCLAIVLDEAFVKGPSADADVTLAEVTAHSEFEDKPDPTALAAALAGGQARSRMAAALLARAGAGALTATAKIYPTLDDAGRLLALEVIDGAPCAESAPVYLNAMQMGRPGEVHHATDRLIRCGRDAAPALADALEKGSNQQKIDSAKLLSLVAPDLAVDKIVALLPEARPDLRSELRAALTRAAQNPAGKKVVRARLADTSLSAVAAVDLLRAAAVESIAMPEASAELRRLVADGADVRTRYLLLAPAAALAEGGDANAEAFVVHAIAADPDGHVRARASEVAGRLPGAGPPLAKALDDDNPRVRSAALTSIATLTDPRGKKVQAEAWPPALFVSVAKLLREDPFSFVRVHAAESLRGAPTGDPGDGPLAAALADESPLVRGRAIDVLGARGARAHASEIAARLDDEQETLDVRARAARALGLVCDMESVDRLTELTKRAASAGSDPSGRVLGASAAAALVRLSPPDVTKRLAPLTDPRAPRLAREIGKTALESTERCPPAAR